MLRTIVVVNACPAGHVGRWCHRCSQSTCIIIRLLSSAARPIFVQIATERNIARLCNVVANSRSMHSHVGSSDYKQPVPASEVNVATGELEHVRAGGDGTVYKPLQLTSINCHRSTHKAQ
eukprot:SAG31_NODE_33_length_32018_cov_69.763088_7_plen_120_part_00